MFTVCPKCALTLVVTAADLRVAQGYVRCGRCSNVFNAIVGLSEDRSGGGAQAASTATTSIIRKAPSIAEDEPARDPLSDTGETEAIYAEPEVDPEEVNFQEVFIEAPKPAPTPAAPPRPSAAPAPAARAPASAPAAPPPRSAPPAQTPAQSRAPAVAQKSASVQASPPPAPKAPPPQEPEPTYTDSIPDVALEFNPEATDVTQVFIEAAPAKKIDLRQITGTFEQIKPPPESPPPPPPPRQAAPRPKASPPPQPPPPPARKRDDVELEDELRTLAARLDITGRQPALKPEPAARPTPPKPEKAPAPKRDTADDVLIYQGSPYNSADTPNNLARKAAASAAKRRLAQPQPPSPSPGPRAVIDDDEQFDAPPVDDAGAYEAAASLTRRPTPRGRRLAWIGGAAALCVVLAAQAIHHNRHDLATNATLNRPLTKFYEVIGVPLIPRWNLALYDVRQLGAFSGGGDDGNLTVRASLKNASNQILPLPLLRITVQDRYGNRIATRDVEPKGYVPGAVPDGAHLGVGQRIDAEMSFKDPGRDAVGFEIDACLPTPEGRIACANDAAVAAR